MAIFFLLLVNLPEIEWQLLITVFRPISYSRSLLLVDIIGSKKAVVITTVVLTAMLIVRLFKSASESKYCVLLPSLLKRTCYFSYLLKSDALLRS